MAGPGVELYLMYAYEPRMNPNFGPGEFVADIKFPLTVRVSDPQTEPSNLESRDITVQIRGALPLALQQPALAVIDGSSSSFFDVFVDLGLGGGSEFAGNFGIDAAVGFGRSPLSDLNHLLVELEIPLLIDPGFFNDGPGPLPEGGSNRPDGGGYSPLPAFWGASIANDGVDPPISAAVFTINPNGLTTVNASGVPTAATVPEPGTLALCGLGLAVVGMQRARRRA